MRVGDTLQLEASLIPSCASQQNVTYQTSSWQIVRPSASGLMTATGAGQVTITTISKADSTKTDSITIIVTQ